MRGMTLLSALVDTSQRVGASPARRTKISALAALLRSLPPEEIEIAVHYLSGELPHGRIGIGYAAVQAAAADRGAPSAILTLADVDRSLTALATQSGPGSTERRTTLLRDLLSRQSRFELAQDQTSSHLGSGRARRRVGARATRRFALESASRRARHGDRRIHHARQNVQRTHGCNARSPNRGAVAPRSPPGRRTKHLPRSIGIPVSGCRGTRDFGLFEDTLECSKFHGMMRRSIHRC